MKRTDRRKPIPAWLKGYSSQPSLEGVCAAMEARIRTREGIPTPWPDAIARRPILRPWTWDD
ncbi:MAG: hypothetical protein FJ078_08895 [Cyanobacteria bacterium K_DeepCast_35m_m2_155]|nr:hypothetical protein [Cyanobacteria bacterium K_DeepCast_35m_m2_155]